MHQSGLPLHFVKKCSVGIRLLYGSLYMRFLVPRLDQLEFVRMLVCLILLSERVSVESFIDASKAGKSYFN